MPLINGTNNDDSLPGTALDDTIFGFDGNDTLEGNDGNDNLQSGNGNDSILGGNGADFVMGGLGIDYLDGGGGSDVVLFGGIPAGVNVNLATGVVSNNGEGQAETVINFENIHGSEFNDVIQLSATAGYAFGRGGSDSIVGGVGSDNFYGGSGNDTINGGGSADSASYFDDGFDAGGVGTQGVVVNLATGTATDNWGNTDTLLSIENVSGSQLADVLTGDAFNNSLSGDAGADSILGLGGSDFITGGAGNDTLDGGVVTDLVNYNDLNTVSYIGATAAVTINMSGVTGTGSTGSGIATGDASVGTDTLINFNFIQGSAHNDTITGSAANWFEQIEGGAGNDSLDGGVVSSAGANRVSYQNTTGAGVVVDLIAGTAVGQAGSNAGSDTLVNFNSARGSNFADTLLGTNRTDFGESFDGRDGDDFIDGKGGFDTLRMDAAAGAVTVNLVLGTSSGAGAGNDTFANMEGVRGSNFNDTITGDGFDNTLDGRSGDDRLLGGGGADSILGVDGSDFINGGAGNDTLDGGVVTDLVNYIDLNTVSYSDATAAVTINTSGITGTGSTGSGTATGDASVGTDVLFNFNFIQGSAHNDTITGSAAAWFEQIEGGAGNDVLDGGLLGNNASNRVTYLNTSVAGVVVDFIAGTAIGQAGSNAGSDTLLNFDFATGSNFADTLLGSNRTDRGETFEGRDGNDSIDGKGGFDTIRFGSASGAVTVSLLAGTSSGLNVGSDTFANIEGVRGSNFNDTITGDGFSNTLDGQGGDDSLLGGAGADTLIGLGGNDTMDGGVSLDRNNNSDNNLTTYSAASAGVSVNLSGMSGDGSVGSGTATGNASVGTDVLINISRIQGSGFNDTITGSTALIFESFDGGAGNDTIDGGAITDTLNRDNGNRVTYEFVAGAGVTVDLIAGTALGALGSNAGNDTLLNIEQVRGSNFSDTLLGSDRTDVSELFEGRDGNDSIDGRGGFDLVRFEPATGGVSVNLVTGTSIGIGGGSGVGSDVFSNIEGVLGSNFDDSLVGGDAANGTVYGDGLSEFFRGNGGNDTIDGGQGYDVAAYNNSTSGVVVTLNDTLDGSASDGLGGTDVLRNIEGVRGSIFNDSLTGSNTAAFESFDGREGNDTLNGNGGTDRVDYFFARAGVTVNLTAGLTINDGYGSTDTLLGIEDVRGSRDFNDTLTGSSGNNTFEGLGGNDTISGGAGLDTAIFSGLKSSYTITKSAGSVTVSGADGIDVLTGVEKLQFSDAAVTLKPAVSDFNADANSDLLWFRQSDGYAYLWTLANNVQTGGNALAVVGSAWTIQTTGDFNGDGSSDFVWKNTSTGQFYTWNFVNGVQSGGADFGVVGTNWNVMGSGDFNADGTSDVVWRDSNTGQLYLWMLQNNAIASSTDLGTLGVAWTVQAVGDFNGDGTSDLALRNTTTGQAYLWNFSNGALSGGASLGNVGTNWTIMGAGDFNANGTDDLAWRNSADGNLYLWMMQNNTVASASGLGAIGSSWTIDAISDVNADATSDLLLKNSSSGQFYIWNITNGAVSGGADLGVVGADWQLI